MAQEQRTIIKKIVKKGHVHHGGAWKLAYADFVTAMMAFFLLMWLIGTTDEETKRGISEYFQDPYEASKIDKGKVPTLDEIAPTEMDKQSEHYDSMQLELLKQKIQDMINTNAKLSEFKEQIKLEITPEGLRIQLIDDNNTPMFKLASSETEPQIRLILRALAPVINNLPNKISINGHTDAKPFPVNKKRYSNWELSSDRANAARYELTQGGLTEDKVLRVTGLSDSIPYNPGDANDPMNRRISILVMNKKTEQHVIQEVGTKQATDITNTAPPLTKTAPDKPLDTGTQQLPEKPLKTDSKPQPDKPLDTGTQQLPEKPLKTDSKPQPDKPLDTGTQQLPEKPLKTDSKPQPDKPLDIGTQQLPEKPLKTDSKPQPDKPLDTGTKQQPKKPLKTDSKPQPEKPLDTGTQQPPEKPLKTDSKPQPDKP